MIGLIKKDLLMIRSNFKILLIMIIMFGYFTVNGNNMLSMFPFMAIWLYMSTFSYDEYNKWDTYAVSLPNGRANVVLAKYLGTLILTFVGGVLSILLMYVIKYLGIDIAVDNFFSEILGTLIGMVLLIIIMYPVIYKFGIEKGRIILFITVFILIGLITLIANSFTISIPDNVTKIFNDYGYYIVPVVMLVGLYISFKISKSIYDKKEF